MSVEQELKDLILENYRSLKSFCVKLDMPPTTLDSILKRGIGKASIGNVIKICHELGIDCDELANGHVVYCVPASVHGESSAHSELLRSFNYLNADGQRKVVEYAEDLVLSGRYEKKSDLPALQSVSE